MTGFKSKRMAAITGKSIWTNVVKNLTLPDVIKVTTATVDGKTWYTVKLTMPTVEWLRKQPKDDWVALDTGYFHVSAKMYSALCLKWS